MEGVNLMDDIRTPITYFTSPQEQVDAFRRINERLDVLVEKLEALKAKRKQGTPAEKKIRENEIEKAELRSTEEKDLMMQEKFWTCSLGMMYGVQEQLQRKFELEMQLQN